MAQRIALVTGGMGGLGEAICMKLEKMGIKVVVTYSPGNTKHKEWLKEMEGQGHKFLEADRGRSRCELAKQLGEVLAAKRAQEPDEYACVRE
jgi:NAD(P)-dependent dehydrogenase (short-subunit alcohol dehydrogenase family)